jgi:hypothetical protein
MLWWSCGAEPHRKAQFAVSLLSSIVSQNYQPEGVDGERGRFCDRSRSGCEPINYVEIEREF